MSITMNGRPFEHYRRLVKETRTHLIYVNSMGFVEQIEKRFIKNGYFASKELHKVKLDNKMGVRPYLYCSLISKEPLYRIIARLFMEGYEEGETITFKDGNWQNCNLLNMELKRKGAFVIEHWASTTKTGKQRVVAVNTITGERKVFESKTDCANYFKTTITNLNSRVQNPNNRSLIFENYKIILKEEKENGIKIRKLKRVQKYPIVNASV